tara:strand:+ start:136 stop:516 length:381 start_codon:yes stop_codon:yes gene_type:complete
MGDIPIKFQQENVAVYIKTTNNNGINKEDYFPLVIVEDGFITNFDKPTPTTYDTWFLGTHGNYLAKLIFNDTTSTSILQYTLYFKDMTTGILVAQLDFPIVQKLKMIGIGTEQIPLNIDVSMIKLN